MTGNTDGLNATPSQFGGNPNRPVEQVSWDDIQVFLARLNDQEASKALRGGRMFCLRKPNGSMPAGQADHSVLWGDTITSDDANYNWDGDWNTGADFKQTRDAGQYSANPWGFFDIHGNVWEWTSDWYATYSSGAVTDPEGPATGSYRVHRGGSWGYPGAHLRSAGRTNSDPSYRNSNMGFRVGYQHISNPPTNLNSTAPLAIAENQPIGTVIGEFNATVPGVGKSLITLSNGKIITPSSPLIPTVFETAITFDYESNASTYSITVQARDAYNATTEGNLRSLQQCGRATHRSEFHGTTNHRREPTNRYHRGRVYCHRSEGGAVTYSRSVGWIYAGCKWYTQNLCYF